MTGVQTCALPICFPVTITLIAFMVRDWEYTKSAGLHDLAWAMCRDAYVSKNDALFLLDELEKHIKGGSEL